MEKRLSLLIVVALFLSLPAFAAVKKVGPYTVDIDILNSAQYTIPSGKLTCDYWDKTIYVKVSATGYQSVKFQFSAASGQTYFKRVVQLADEEKVFKAIDFNYNPIKIVYFDKTQFGADPNFFQLKAFIPIKTWHNPTVKGVDIYDDFWGAFLKKSGKIETVEDFYQVTMTMSRKALANTAKTLYVVFNLSGSAGREQATKWVSALRRAEKAGSVIPEHVLEGSARFITDNLEPSQLEEAGADASRLLRQRISELEQFETAHKIPRLSAESLLQFGN